ncbi:WHG domain-containing protein [Marmoricola sp. URHA0025 HA25]
MTTTSLRATYHHGDLRNALVDAAADLAERGGPDAVTIRAAARGAGVTPTAAYRHFAGHAELLDAAKGEALERMATMILEALGDPPEGGDAVDAALHRMRAGGRGYVRFALAQPGLFRTAFCRSTHDDLQDARAALAAAPPHAFLTEALDELVEVGWLDPALRPHAETPAWAAVHGLSLLLLDGPYQSLDDAEREALIDATLEMTLRGLAGGPAAR